MVNKVKNHLLPIITKLNSTYDMMKSLEDMFEINNTYRRLTLKNQLSNIKMNRGENITSYLMRVTDLRNQLLTIGHVYDSKELILVTLNGLPSSWENFRQGVCAHSKLSKFDRLKADCIQEECNLISRGIIDESKNEGFQALTTKLKGKKGKYSHKRQRDYSKVQCFRCDKYGHTATICPDRIKHQASFSEVSNPNLNLETSPF